MKAIIQRVLRASVYADGAFCGKIDKGLYILLGVEADDDKTDAELLCNKIVKLRIFSDENDKMNLSLLDVGGDAMVVSNFTLNANYEHGNRPDYFSGASPALAEELYEYFKSLIKKVITKVECGEFGADMKTEMVTDGPVTIFMESKKLRKGKNKL